MKKILLFILAILFALESQCQILDSLTLSELKLNFAVPDMPAFKTLGTEPSNLLKPSTPKEFAVTMSQFFDNQKAIIPKSFAMEISPALLINANKGPVGIQQYAKNAWINSFRISLGTSSDTILSPAGRSLAMGFRITPIDKSDPVGDTSFLKSISYHLLLLRESESMLRTEFAKTHIDSIKKWMNSTADKLEDIQDWDLILSGKIKNDNAVKKMYNDFTENARSFDNWINEEKENRKKYDWNVTKLDIAFAILSSSPDSAMKNIQFNKADVWITYAHRCGKSAQYLIGVNGSMFKNLKDKSGSSQNNIYWNIAIPARFVLGTNRVKGFAELQYKYNTNAKISNTLFDLGTELNIVDGVWINWYAGIQNSAPDGINSFIANLNVKLTLSEKFKLF